MLSSNYNNIPQRNIDLTNGFIKEIGISSDIIPIELNHLCLAFINLNTDQFCRVLWFNDNHEIENIDNRIVTISEKLNLTNRLIYLRNIVDQGVNIWKFKHIELRSKPLGRGQTAWSLGQLFKHASIGIVKSQYINQTNHKQIKSFLNLRCYNLTGDNVTNTGYEITHRGDRLKLKVKDEVYDKIDNFGIGIKNGDIVELRLNMNELTLSVKLNGSEYIKLFDVDDSKYSAIVSVNQNSNGWELLSYQHIY